MFCFANLFFTMLPVQFFLMPFWGSANFCFYKFFHYSPLTRSTGQSLTIWAIPISCFVSHRSTDPLSFKIPFKENQTEPYFFEITVKKKAFDLKELYYFEIIFLVLIFFSPTDRPNLSSWRAMGNETFYWYGLAISGLRFQTEQ